MGFEVNKETLQAVVEANKGSKSFYVTEDGHFFTENNKSHAVNHASGRKLRWKQVDPDGNEVSKSEEVISDDEEDYNPVTASSKNFQELVAEKAAKEAEEKAAEEKAAKEAEAQAAKEAEVKAAKEAEEKAAEEKAAKEAEVKAAAGQAPAPKKTPGTRKAGNKTTTKTSDK